MLIDEKFKDSTPEKTVETILELLSGRGIETEERWFDSKVKNCYSVRVVVKGTDFGANGKGITPALARASGFAELMERMQAGYLTSHFYRDELVDYGDGVKMNREAFRKACGPWLEDISAGVSRLFGSQISPEKIEKKCFEADGAGDQSLRVLPFYDATEDRMVYFPQKIISSLYNTNGLSAGNTFAEAFVQGFSEVIERNLIVRCFFRGITPPDVPEEYLSRFEKSYEIIQYLRSKGLDIYIKDCSMGCSFPLLAAVAIDRSRHSYHVHMGSHPVFEIALERCLTEMFQGRSLANVANTAELFVGNPAERSVSELVGLLTKGCGRYASSFFVGTPSYAFAPPPDRSAMSNRQLLKEIVDYVKAQGHHLLVRSVSHLGFTSVRIIVPGMSEALPNNLSDPFPQLNLMGKYADAARILPRLDEAQRREYQMYLNHQVGCYGPSATNYAKLSGRNITGGQPGLNDFLGRMVFASLEWDVNRGNAMKYAKAALPFAPAWAEPKLSALFLLFDYLRKGRRAGEAMEEMKLFFDEETLTYLRQVVTEGMDPFASFLPDCTDETCGSCQFRPSCNARATEELIRKVRTAAREYDNGAAFAEIRALFCSL